MKMRRIELKANKYGWILTAVIIACRAISPNSLPMEEWSTFSWILMTSPMTWPLLVYILARLLGWLFLGIDWIYKKTIHD